jgi:ubiquinol oxidase
MKALSCCLFALAVFEKAVNAFSPPNTRARFRGFCRHNYSQKSLRSTASESEIDQREQAAAIEGLKIDTDVRKQAAIEALEKLLERQREEVADSEALLKQLKDFHIGSEEMSKRAASVLSGVDYGFISRSEGAVFTNIQGGLANSTTQGSAFERYGPPSNILELGIQQFMRNLNAIMGEYKDEEGLELTPEQQGLQDKLDQLTLDSDAIWEREMAEGALDGAPWVLKIPYLIICYMLDRVFEGRYVPARFFLLETVARMPYFSYITMLHLYETLGFWRRSSDIKRIHFAEEWNEFNHLLIMESLGGDQRWWVRFMAQHSAIVYFLVLNHLWALSPTLAYKFSELLEGHAVNTYGQFLDENEALLKELPPSTAAINYYSFGFADPLFEEYQTTAISTGSELRKPGDDMQSLYDVFDAIKADEGDHVGTMKACLDPNVAVQSPSLEQKVLIGASLVFASALAVQTGVIDIPSIDMLKDALDTGSNIAVDDTAAEVMVGAVGAGATFMREFFGTDEEVGATTELLESGTLLLILEATRKAILQFIAWLSRIIAALSRSKD